MLNPKHIIAAAKQYLEDRKLIMSYLRGEVDKAALDAKGIKLATPVQPQTLKEDIL